MTRDVSDWSRMTYPQAVAWMIQNNDTAWLATDQPSARAIVISDLFKTPLGTLREDLQAASLKSQP